MNFEGQIPCSPLLKLPVRFCFPLILPPTFHFLIVKDGQVNEERLSVNVVSASLKFLSSHVASSAFLGLWHLVLPFYENINISPTEYLNYMKREDSIVYVSFSYINVLWYRK